MAATKSQGKAFTVFVAGVTVGAAGLAAVSTGLGKVGLVVGLALTAVSLAVFLKIKPEEGDVPKISMSAGLKLLGLVLAISGWLIVIAGLNLSTSVSGRMAATIVGMVVTLAGIIGVLPFAANKNAIWKA
ncbi:MAG TPA: hypothetical protein VGL22_00440 [Terracidiphilus sp.]|jgi:hypothetical protein